MLSIVNSPAPEQPDPSCNGSNSDDHDKLSHSHNHLLPVPDLDHHHHTPLPNFSIRDYVFTARSKDIKNNWPFSPKHLQLCFRLGLKDVLPPFQPFDTLRSQWLERRKLETTSSDKKEIIDFDKETSGPDDHIFLLKSSFDGKLKENKLVESCVHISSCGAGQENEFPSTTSVSQFEIDSLPDDRKYSSTVTETETLLKASAEVEPAVLQVNRKTENSLRPSGKRCRLVVKFGSKADRSSNEDISSNCPDTMASKVCPVCKTFSSSSNTTLNAHIDQCLSMESTTKWASDSKATRYKTKPRKTKLMVDIYATAKRCTLEDLDRRNGTSWTALSTWTSHETGNIETSRKGKKHMLSLHHPEDATDDVGPVYIDESGTKLRILSKVNHPPQVSKVGEDIGVRKLLKGGKLSKQISKIKKKELAHRQLKHLKLAPQISSFSQKPHSCLFSEDVEGNKEEAKRFKKVHQMSEEIGPSDSGTLRPWICSKKRGTGKKIAGQEGYLPVKCKWHLPQDLLVDHNDQSLSGTSFARRNADQQSPKLSDKPVYKTQVSEKSESCAVARDGISVHGRCMPRSHNCNRSHALSRSKKNVDCSVNDSEVSPPSCIKSLHCCQVSSAKAKSFSSFKKIMLSKRTLPLVGQSRVGKTKKSSVFNNFGEHFMTKRDEELAARHPEVDRECDMAFDYTEGQLERDETADMSFGRSTSFAARQQMECISETEKALSLRNSKYRVHNYGHHTGINEDFSIVDGSSQCEDDGQGSASKQVVLHGEDVASELSSKTSDGRSAINVPPEFSKLSNLKEKSYSFESTDDFNGLSSGSEAPSGPGETDCVSDQDMFLTDVGNGMIGQNTDTRTESDSEAALRNSFPEVDPIPIPGPPGSFLPSPGDMGSEEFQGNSSLMTTPVQSSSDQRDVVDADSSDSPISAASTLFNSTAVKPDYNHLQPSSSAGPCAVEEKLTSSFMAATVETSVRQGSTVPLSLTKSIERSASDVGFVRVDKIPLESGYFSFKNDQPCCCQRKGDASNNQEPQPLRLRKISPFHPIGKQSSGYSVPRPTNLDLKAELIPPSSIPTSGSNNVVVPAIKPSTDPTPVKEFSSAGIRLMACGDCDSSSPSASNPVLRLMGKNLMVVNKDEDLSLPMEQVQPHKKDDLQASQFRTLPDISPGNAVNKGSQNMHQPSIIYGQFPHNSDNPYSGRGLVHSLGSHSDLIFQQATDQLSASVFQNHCTGSAFAMPMDCPVYESGRMISGREDSLKLTSSISGSYRTEKVMRPSDHRCKQKGSRICITEEIPVINDVSDGKTTMIPDIPKHTECWKEGQLYSSGISGSTGTHQNTAGIRALSYYRTQDHTPFDESPVFNSAFPGTPNRLVSTSPSILPRSPFVPASSSSGRLIPAALYRSPSFS